MITTVILFQQGKPGLSITDVYGNIYNKCNNLLSNLDGENLKTSRYNDGNFIPNIKIALRGQNYLQVQGITL